jgi:hydroxymethylpyrimidine/phosphomethylpyrimidine kinase
MERFPIVLSIAGFDPSSGAGITADIKTIAAHHCYGIACVTALTVQSTRGVVQVVPVNPDLVRSTIQELTSDLAPAAIKIGMLGSREVAEAVASYLELSSPPNIVLDPVLRSSSGMGLLDTGAIEVLLGRLLVHADVITPNLDEAAALTGGPVSNLLEMKIAAAKLRELGAKAVVVKGGHLSGEETVEFLSYSDGGQVCEREFRGPRLQTRATHGTGCAFSSSLACHLALGRKLPEAVDMAKQYVTTAMRQAHELGSGTGPLNHFGQI